MTDKAPWSFIPESICQQARTRWGKGQRAAGPGDGCLYHWIREEPQPEYCGPMPFGRLVRRVREG